MADTRQLYAFGRDTLGPVFALYLLRLHHTIGYFEREYGAKTLFVSRAGIRIKQLYGDFCDATGHAASPNAEIFWISRMMTAKGVYSRNSEQAMKLFVGEYENGTLREALNALLRGVGETVADDDPELDEPGWSLPEYLAGNKAAAQQVRAHLDEQSQLFESYVSGLVSDSKRVLLVDSGWAGSAQRLLTEWRPELDWWGAYIGRFGFANTDRSAWPRMIGLLFESDDYLAAKPETALRLHRHMLERLLEPAGPSIEALTRIGDRIVPNGAEQVLMDTPTPMRDPLFCGIQRYIKDELAQHGTPSAILQKAQATLPGLARTLAFPNANEARLLGDGDRTADFGRDLSVPILISESQHREHDSVERRLNDSLWRQGQIVLEYPEHMATKLQQKSLPAIGDASLIETSPWDRALRIAQLQDARAKCIGAPPRAAVITRTMDRPIMLKRALDSVAGQTIDNYTQVVVCDGGPIPAAVAAIEDSDADLRRTRLIDTVTNRGMEAASNIAISQCVSDYLLIHDDDDTLEPDFLKETIEFLDQPGNDKYGGVVTHSTYVSEEIVGDAIEEHDRRPYNDYLHSIYLEEHILINSFAPIGFLFRRAMYDHIGGFDQQLPVLGDWDFNLRMLEVSDIGVIPRPLSNYHHRDVGNTHLYGNTVVAGLDAHTEYDAILRNRYVRKMGGTVMGGLMGQSRTLRQIRDTLWKVAADHESLPTIRTDAPAPGADAWADEANRLQRQLHEMKTSTSWLVTAPIRAMARIFPRFSYLAGRILRWVYWTLTLQLPTKLKERKGFKQTRRQEAG